MKRNLNSRGSRRSRPPTSASRFAKSQIDPLPASLVADATISDTMNRATTAGSRRPLSRARVPLGHREVEVR